jgi:hypothetical protein
MDRTLWAKDMAKQLVKTSTFRSNWSPAALEIWLRDGCRCVYCDRDMLESRDTTYYFWCAEHVLPVHKYEHLKHAVWNQVLSCHPCNQLKHRFDPAYDGTLADEANLSTFIERARAHIEKRKVEMEALFVHEAKLLRDSMDAFGKAAFSATP